MRNFKKGEKGRMEAKTNKEGIQVLAKPYTEEEIKKEMSPDGTVSGNISVDITDIICRDFEGFLDFITEKLVGLELLSDIQYHVVGSDGDMIILSVSGILEYFALDD